MGQREQVNLLTLPTEIQIKIFSHLAVSFGKSTIQAVLRTCKQLYIVALPLSVSVFRNTVCYPKDRGPCSQARNIQFLRYILISKPWLVTHVKTLILGSFSVNDEDTDDEDTDDEDTDDEEDADSKALAQGDSTIAAEDLATYQQHIEFILGQLPSGDTTEWCASWVYDLKRGSPDAQVALILLTCPNIRALLFEMSYSRHFLRLLQLAGTMISINASIQTPGSEWGDGNYPEMIIPLLNLRDISQEQRDSDEGYQEFYLEASSLFSLPRLRFYECIGAKGMSNAASHFKSLPRRASPVEDIILYHAFITADMLWNMLGACRALKQLEFSYMGLKPPPERFDSVMPRDILDGILPHSNTLRYLYLNLQEDVDHQWNWSGCPERLYMGIGLRQMNALKVLVVGMQALTGILASPPTVSQTGHNALPLEIEGAARIIDCLPESLEYLTIHSCGLGILDQVQELVKIITQGHRFKNLNYIGVLFHAWRVDIQEITNYMDNHLGSADGPNAERFIRVDGPNVQRFITVDTGFQTISAAYHDLISLFSNSSDRPKNCRSRIYAPNLRCQYLKRRMNTRYVDGIDTYEIDPSLYEG